MTVPNWLKVGMSIACFIGVGMWVAEVTAGSQKIPKIEEAVGILTDIHDRARTKEEARREAIEKVCRLQELSPAECTRLMD